MQARTGQPGGSPSASPKRFAVPAPTSISILQTILLPLVEASEYQGFAIGSAIHAGHWLKPGIEFVRNNVGLLRDAPVWLFSSGPLGDKGASGPQPDPKEIDDIRDLVDVRNHVVFGGAFDPETADLERVGWIEKQISTHFLPVGDWRNWDEIEAWAREIAVSVAADREPIAVS